MHNQTTKVILKWLPRFTARICQFSVHVFKGKVTVFIANVRQLDVSEQRRYGDLPRSRNIFMTRSACCWKRPKNEEH